MVLGPRAQAKYFNFSAEPKVYYKKKAAEICGDLLSSFSFFEWNQSSFNAAVSVSLPTGLPVGVKLGAVISSQRPESDESDAQPQSEVG